MKIKKERLKQIIKEELGNTVNEKFDFSNIANVELARRGDPDLLDLGPIPRSYKVYKVTLGIQGLYFYLKHFSDPMKNKLMPIGVAPKIPDMLVGMASKAIEKAIQSLAPDVITLGADDEKPKPGEPGYKPAHAVHPYAKGVNEMKITKQRLKEIIKEELKNSQNEGFFSRVGASLGRKNKMHGYAFPQFKKVFDKFRSADDKDPVALLQAAQEIMKARRNYVKSMKKDTGVDGGEWSQELNSDQFKEYQDLYNTSIRYTGRMLRQAYELDRRAKLRKEIEAAKEAQRIELEQAKAERAEARAEAERNRKDKKDPKDARPNFAIGQQDRKAKTFGFGANESKITKSALKAIIAEELEEVLKEREQLDDDKYYLMDFDRVYKGPFDSYDKAEEAEEEAAREGISGLRIQGPKPKFSPEEIAAAKARAAKFGL